MREARDSGVDAATEKRQAAAEARAASEEKRCSAKEVKLTVRRLCLDYHDDRIEDARKPNGAAEVRHVCTI